MTVRKAFDRLRTVGKRMGALRLTRIRSLSRTGTMKLFTERMQPLRARLKSSAERMKSKAGAWRRKPPQAEVETAATVATTQPKVSFIAASLPKLGNRCRDGFEWLRSYRLRLLSAVGALGIASAITMGGNHYVKINTFDAYHVLVNGEDIGIVSNPQVVEDVKLAKYKELEQNYPDTHMVLNADGITFEHERAFKIKSDDTTVVEKLGDLLVARPVGVQLKVEDKVIGVLKDKDTAQQVLDQIKAAYIPAKSKDAGKVSILSAPKELDVGDSQIDKIDFVQNVALDIVDVKPEELAKPEDVLNKLKTGDVQPTKYTVEKGDCVGCIAKKFNISRQVIYQNNPWIVDDMIKVGQVLDLTVLQPTLSVRTVETVVENQEIQYDTEYVKDDSLRAGVVQMISPGKNGMKKVKIQVTKVNGLMEDEQMLNEEIITQPVKAVAKKGTKVVLGEGTGKFAWPVVGASISSGFGTRWGAFHKGVDLTSGNKNILSADNGKVIYTGYKSDYGNHIIIDHLNGYRTLYGHLSSIGVKVGQIVEKGEKIGIMGSTGDSTGVHLHFEIRVSDSPENPLKYLNR